MLGKMDVERSTASEAGTASLGIQWAKFVCVVACLLALWGGIFGHSTRTNRAVDLLFRAISIITGLLLAGFFYGMQRRLKAAWTLGWILPSVFLFEFLIPTLLAVATLIPKPAGWIASILLLTLTFGVAMGYGRWWNRQRGYFFRPGL